MHKIKEKKKETESIKKYINTYIFQFNVNLNSKKDKNYWTKYIIPLNKKQEKISKNIDKILY